MKDVPNSAILISEYNRIKAPKMCTSKGTTKLFSKSGSQCQTIVFPNKKSGPEAHQMALLACRNLISLLGLDELFSVWLVFSLFPSSAVPFLLNPDSFSVSFF